jgi:hypothetical protein
MVNHLELPFGHRVYAGLSRGRLCLNQTAYELHALSFGQRPASDDLVLHHLRTPHEIDAVRPLRAKIDLSHNASDPQFASDEKKETCWA